MRACANERIKFVALWMQRYLQASVKHRRVLGTYPSVPFLKHTHGVRRPTFVFLDMSLCLVVLEFRVILIVIVVLITKTIIISYTKVPLTYIYIYVRGTSGVYFDQAIFSLKYK